MLDQRFGAYHTLAHELYINPEKSKQYIRMSKAHFDHTDRCIGFTPIIEKVPVKVCSDPSFSSGPSASVIHVG